jgi:hypothetical protein
LQKILRLPQNSASLRLVCGSLIKNMKTPQLTCGIPDLSQFDTDNLIEASIPCQRAVQETVEVLQLAGYECVEIDVTRLDSE